MVHRDSVSAQDERLIEGYLAGERAAYRTIDGWIQAIVLGRYGGLAHLKDDLCQTVHANLVREFQAARYAGRGDLRAYVSAIAHRNALSELRRQYRDRAWSEPLEHEPAGGLGNPYGAITAADEIRTVHAVLMALPASCRELWKLIFVDKLDYETVADRLGVPTGTVKSRMWHCRRKATEALRRVRLRSGLRSTSGGALDHLEGT